MIVMSQCVLKRVKLPPVKKAKTEHSIEDKMLKCTKDMRWKADSRKGRGSVGEAQSCSGGLSTN